jgi:hypothetical protein
VPNCKLNGTTSENGGEIKAGSIDKPNGKAEANGVEAKTDEKPLVVQEV